MKKQAKRSRHWTGEFARWNKQTPPDRLAACAFLLKLGGYISGRVLNRIMAEIREDYQSPQQTRNKTGLPFYAPGTIREFKQRKRRQIRQLQRAADSFVVGSAFTPGPAVVGLTDWLIEAKEALSIRSWGR